MPSLKTRLDKLDRGIGADVCQCMPPVFWQGDPELAKWEALVAAGGPCPKCGKPFAQGQSEGGRQVIHTIVVKWQDAPQGEAVTSGNTDAAN